MEDTWAGAAPRPDRPEIDADFDLEPDEDSPLWQWVGAACGIAAVVALLASSFIVAQPPNADAPAAKILSYYVDNRRALLFSQWLAGVGAALFLWFVGSLRGAWGRSDTSAAELSGVAFAGGIALGAVELAAVGLNLTLVYIAREIQNSPDLVRALYAAQFLTATVLFFAAAVFLAGGGLLIRRLGAPWLGAAAIALAVFDLFAAGAISDFRGMRSPTGPLTLLAYLGLLAWVLVTSIVLLTRLGRPAADLE